MSVSSANKPPGPSGPIDFPAGNERKRKSRPRHCARFKTEIQTDPSVRIDSAKIGGPSAGLMFSLEVLNRLMPEDLTRGYRIAGTGTISPDGQVGQIGGIEYKITAAAEKGAEPSFCPADKTR